MSYLRGPLTRDQIRLLTPSVAETPETSAVERPEPSAARAVARGRPVVPLGIEEAFMGSGAGVYRPYLFAEVSLHYVRASHDLDAWERFVILAPLDEEPSWPSAELLDPDEADLGTEPPDDAEFVAPPAGLVGEARFRSYAKQMRNHLYQNRTRTLWRCKSLGLRSAPEESKADFSARVQLASREKRDAAIDKLRVRYEKKMKQALRRVRRAEIRVDREKDQYEQQKVQTGISMGATVLGAIFGRGGIGRATTAARGAGRIAREREDVLRAEDALEELRDAHEALEAEAEHELAALRAEQEKDPPEIEEMTVRPRKSDLEVRALTLVWKRD